MKDSCRLDITGHVKIVDDLGNIHVDQHNDVHPQNMARVIARALANEDNYQIGRVAFGNGGTSIDASFQITYKTPNDGLPPDIATWDSRLYHETYSEIVDEGNPSLNPLLGTDPGSADASGVRSGGGSVPANDPPSVVNISGPGVRSTDLGLTSEVTIVIVLNKDEPTGQFTSDFLPPSENPDDVFVFDEIGLYSQGIQAVASSGYHYVDVGNKVSTDATGLSNLTIYSFNIVVNGAAPVTINIPASAGNATYGGLVANINSALTTAGITDVTAFVTNTTTGVQTYGYLKFSNNNVVSLLTPISTVVVSAPSIGTNLFSSLGGTLLAPIAGTDAGVQNAPNAPTTERERLLTHLVFSPVRKSANRTFTITYTLTIAVARTA